MFLTQDHTYAISGVISFKFSSQNWIDDFCNISTDKSLRKIVVVYVRVDVFFY